MSHNGDGPFDKSPFVHEPILTPERILWRGVLIQAYADAELLARAESEDELVLEQIRARRFLRADTPDEGEELRLVCDYADIPFDRVVTWAKKHYAPPTRQELKKVKARDAKEIEEIVKAVKDREAATLALSEFPSPLRPLPRLSPLLQ